MIRLAPEGLVWIAIQCISEAASLRTSVETLTAGNGRRGGPSTSPSPLDAVKKRETNAERKKRLAAIKEKEKDPAGGKVAGKTGE